MKLSELIAKYGDEDVQFQNLDGSIMNVEWSMIKLPTTKVTFGTDAPLNKTKDGMKELGLVAWFDREKLDNIMEGGAPERGRA